jgi:phenylacetate-CoA ligase
MNYFSTLRSLLSQHIMYPLNLWHKGISKRKLSAFLKRDLCSQDRIRELQAQNLREFLSYAGQHTTIYREMFKECSVNPHAEEIFAEIRKLPPLSKAMIRNNLPGLISDEYSGRKDLITKATGGSTGEPLIFYGDLEDYRQNGLIIARHHRWIGWEGAPKVVSLFGGFRDVPSSMNRSLKRLLINDTVINIMDSQSADYVEILKQLRRNPPQVLIGYFSILCQVARAAEAEGKPLQKVNLSVACAEPLDEKLRVHAEKWLGTKIYFQYGCRELGAIAQECKVQNGYHYAQDLILCEILDDQDQPADYGHLTITYMGNLVVPLIRYQIGDGAAMDESPCSCGLPWHRLKVIDGRISSMVVLPDGSQVTSMIFPHLLKDFAWILEYQVEQVAPDHIRIRVRTEGGSSFQESETLATSKLQVLLGDVNIEWLLNEPFISVPTGKHVYFVSRLN